MNEPDFILKTNATGLGLIADAVLYYAEHADKTFETRDKLIETFEDLKEIAGESSGYFDLACFRIEGQITNEDLEKSVRIVLSKKVLENAIKEALNETQNN